ncbi:tyrosine-type recombinase/integrase [Salmonella enterica]|nr:tyrosine-type recombinase/integrase [Salmonella enterica]
MLVKPLTVTEVKGAKPRDRDYSLHDGFGMLLHISRAGGKSWRFRYQHPDTKKRQTYTIGRFPEFTLAEAREVRDELRRMVARGIDPLRERKIKQAEMAKINNQTFEKIALTWLDLKKNNGLKPLTVKNITRIVEAYLIPLLGKELITEIKAPHVISVFKKYSDRSSLLNRCIGKINEIMNHAVNTGVIPSNPLTKIKTAFKKHTEKSMTMLPVERLPEFLEWWDQKKFTPLRLGVLFQMLTMVRPHEAYCAEWSEIDFDKKEWLIPAARMKMNREHVVPLSSQALAILEEMKKIRYGQYVFFSQTNPKTPIKRWLVSSHMCRGKFKGEVTCHGFRSMWSTLLNEEGFNPDVIEAALAHKSGNAIRDIYNRTTYLEQRRIMMQWVGDFLDSARAGVITRSGGHKGLRVVNE